MKVAVYSLSIMISIMSESENLQKLNFVYDISSPSRSIDTQNQKSQVMSAAGQASVCECRVGVVWRS